MSEDWAGKDSNLWIYALTARSSVFIEALAASSSSFFFCSDDNIDFNFDPAVFIWSIILSLSFKLVCSVSISLADCETLASSCEQLILASLFLPE